MELFNLSLYENPQKFCKTKNKNSIMFLNNKHLFFHLKSCYNEGAVNESETTRTAEIQQNTNQGKQRPNLDVG